MTHDMLTSHDNQIIIQKIKFKTNIIIFSSEMKVTSQEEELIYNIPHI